MWVKDDPDFLREALAIATCAAFIKDTRMKFREANKVDRKSGRAHQRSVFSYSRKLNSHSGRSRGTLLNSNRHRYGDSLACDARCADGNGNAVVPQWSVMIAATATSQPDYEGKAHAK